MQVNSKGKSLVYGVTKVVREGSCVYLMKHIRSTRRNGVLPLFSNSGDGFRVAIGVKHVLS